MTSSQTIRDGEDVRSAVRENFWRLIASAADKSVWLRLSAAVCAAAAAAGFAVAAPILLSNLVDRAGERASGAPLFGALALGALYVGALSLSRLAEQAQAYMFGTGEQHLQQRLSARAFSHVLRLPLAFHLDCQAGGLVQTLTMGLQGARLILTHIVFSVLPVLLQLGFIAIVVIAAFDAKVWVILLVGLVIYGVVFALGVRRLADATRGVSEAQVETGGLFSDGLANVEPVKAFSAERDLSVRYEEVLAGAEKRWRSFHARRFENGLFTVFVFACVLGAALLQGVLALAAGEISVGRFILLNSYILQIVRPLEMAGFALRDVAQGGAYLQALMGVLRTPCEALETERTSAPFCAELGGEGGEPARPLSAPAIAFERVSFAYGERGEVLSDISFTIAPGRTLAVVGPSGAGKSSLVRLLLRFYEPSSGRILIDGTPISEQSLDQVRGLISVVSQETVLFNASFARNVAFARPEASQGELERAIARARISDLVSRLPQGLGTLVGERGLKLSGGERQRVAIARAALKDAPILILDEATSALDAETERAVWSDMIEAASGRTTLIVTHRLAAARLADSILVMDRGRVAEEGVHEDLLRAGGVYARLWRRQSAQVETDLQEQAERA